MKVLLVQVARGGDGGEVWRPFRLWFHGLTLPYLAALFSPRASVQIVDELLEPIPYDADCDLVGLSFMGAALPRALEVADRFRARRKPVVAGGPTASAHAELVRPHVDSLVLGDAEGLVDRMLDDLERGRLEPVYRQPEPLRELLSPPLPRYDLIDRRRVGPYFPVEATRGCAVGCRFCLSSHLFGRVQRRKPIEAVARDLQDLASRKVRRVLLVDDNPMADRRYFAELLEALAPFRFRWTANATADVLQDEPLLDRLALAGCESLSVGFETLVPGGLDWVGKGHLEPSSYAEGIRRLKERGIQTAGMFVLGLETDGPETFEAIERFILENRIEMGLFHILTPVMGTPLHHDLSAQGRLLASELADHGADHAVFRPARLSPEALEESFWALQQRVYSVASILRRLVLVRPDRHYLRRLPAVVANLYFGYLARHRRMLI